MKQQKITASAFILHQGKVLLVKRSETETFAPNHWELPGGHMDFGETIEEGLRRECIEELELNVEVKDSFFSFTYVTDEGESHYVEIINLCILTSDNPKIKLNPKEHSEYKWASSKEELKDLEMFYLEKEAVIKGFEFVQARSK